MNEFSIEHDGRFSLSLTCSERYHGHHEQVSNKSPRSLPQNVPPGGNVPCGGEQGERAVFAGFYCVTCTVPPGYYCVTSTVPTIPSPYLTLLVSQINNPNRIFEMNCK